MVCGFVILMLDTLVSLSVSVLSVRVDSTMKKSVGNMFDL